MVKVWSRNSVSALLLARSVKTSRRAQFLLPWMYEAVRRMSSCSSSARTPTGLGGATMIDCTSVTCEYTSGRSSFTIDSSGLSHAVSPSPSEVEGASGGGIDSGVTSFFFFCFCFFSTLALADASHNGGVSAVALCTTFPSIVPSIQISTLPAASDLLDSNVQQFFASNRSDRFAMRYTVLNWPRTWACARQASSAMVRQRKVSSLLSGLRETNVWLSKHLCTSATSGTSHASSGSGDMLGCLPQVVHGSRLVCVSCCSRMSTSHLERWLSSGVQESDAPTSPTQPTDPLPSKTSAETRSLRSNSSLTSRVCISSKAGTMTCSKSRERDTFERSARTQMTTDTPDVCSASAALFGPCARQTIAKRGLTGACLMALIMPGSCSGQGFASTSHPRPVAHQTSTFTQPARSCGFRSSSRASLRQTG
eukprot:scaffold4873_cov74-Phaeocystis_antarctica.AAC.2